MRREVVPRTIESSTDQRLPLTTPETAESFIRTPVHVFLCRLNEGTLCVLVFHQAHFIRKT